MIFIISLSVGKALTTAQSLSTFSSHSSIPTPSQKEVERRRREAINEGITRLSQIVPGCEPKTTHKGMIIQKAVAYIETLKADEVSNIEKWTFEKLLMDEAMAGLKDQLADAHRQIQTLREEREVLMGAGVGNENGGRDYIDGDGEDRKRMRL